jgi:hypothetical protein
VTCAAFLLNTPTDEPSWNQWAFQLDQNIRDIAAALLTKQNVVLPQYQISPISWPAINEWLERVSTVIDQICANTGAKARDVERVNLDDQREKQAWVYAIYSEIQQARMNLAI